MTMPEKTRKLKDYEKFLRSTITCNAGGYENRKTRENRGGY